MMSFTRQLQVGYISVNLVNLSIFLITLLSSHAYIFYNDSKVVKTFASYDAHFESFSDRNVFPKGCIKKIEKIFRHPVCRSQLPQRRIRPLAGWGCPQAWQPLCLSFLS